MIRVRPAQQDDISDLMALVAKAGLGMTTMPQSQQAMLNRIYLSQEAFARSAMPTHNETFFLVLEDDGKVIGTSCIFTRLGFDRPFYSYRISHLTNQSPELDIRVDTDVVYLVNDYHGFTEIGTLFVDPDCRGAGVGRLLSFSRFMLMAANPGRFGDNIMAEIRGWSDCDESFPFWEHVASKFFDMSFVEADKRSAHDFRFIADLMPKYPIYAELLPSAAQEILGKPHDNSRPAMELLMAQGFRYTNLIDIFDGGPSVEVHTDNIVMIKETAAKKVVAGIPPAGGEKALISTAGLADFSCIQTEINLSETDSVSLDPEMMAALGVNVGDTVLASLLKGRN